MTAGETSGEIPVLNRLRGGRSAPRESPSKGALLGSVLLARRGIEWQRQSACLCSEEI